MFLNTFLVTYQLKSIKHKRYFKHNIMHVMLKLFTIFLINHHLVLYLQQAEENCSTRAKSHKMGTFLYVKEKREGELKRI